MKKKIAATLILVTMVLVIFASCATPAKQIVGTWESETSILGVETKTTYVFNEDGTGSITTVLDLKTDITYSITDEKLTITMNTLGIETDTQYTYDFEGDTLTLVGNGMTITMTKQK